MSRAPWNNISGGNLRLDQKQTILQSVQNWSFVSAPVDNLDTLKLKLTKCEFGFKSGPSTVVSIFINDKSLIDIVREIELPYATKEGCPYLWQQCISL